MTEALVVSSLVLSLITVVLLIFILLRSLRSEKIDALSEELRAGREEAGRAAKDMRDEISRSLKDANVALTEAHLHESSALHLNGNVLQRFP